MFESSTKIKTNSSGPRSVRKHAKRLKRACDSQCISYQPILVRLIFKLFRCVVVVVCLKLRWMLRIFLRLYSFDIVYIQFSLRKRMSKNFTSQFLITLSLFAVCSTGDNHSWVICVTDHIQFQVEFFPIDRLLSCL